MYKTNIQSVFAMLICFLVQTMELEVEEAFSCDGCSETNIQSVLVMLVCFGKNN